MRTHIAGSGRKTRWDWAAIPGILVMLVAVAAGIAYLENLSIATLLVALSSWLHVLATIIMIGYFIFTSLIYLPVLERQLPPDTLRELLEKISARLRPFFGGSLLIFLVTGTHLMLINPHYLGLGNFFGNPWSLLIVIKHGLVLAFVALAVISERAFLGKVTQNNPEALKRFRLALNTNLVLGMLILLLTAIAQAPALP